MTVRHMVKLSQLFVDVDLSGSCSQQTYLLSYQKICVGRKELKKIPRSRGPL
jgi:hypothetical protein